MLHTYIHNYYICVHHHVTHVYKLLLLNLCSSRYTLIYTTITTFLCSPRYTHIYTTITSVFTTMLYTYIHYYYYISVHHVTHIYTSLLHLSVHYVTHTHIQYFKVRLYRVPTSIQDYVY